MFENLASKTVDDSSRLLNAVFLWLREEDGPVVFFGGDPTRMFVPCFTDKELIATFIAKLHIPPYKEELIKNPDMFLLTILALGVGIAIDPKVTEIGSIDFIEVKPAKTQGDVS